MPTFPDSGSSPNVHAWPEHGRTEHGERVLVLAPKAGDAHYTSVFLTKAEFSVCVVADSGGLCSHMVEGCGAVIIAEEALTKETSAEIFGLLSRQPAWSDVPVIIITTGGARGAERMQRLRQLGFGTGATVLERPFRPETLISALEVALRSRRRQYQVRRLLTELAEARDVAERASQAKDDFLATLSHELRTPLNPVLLLATEAAGNNSLAANVRGDFDLIARSVELEARLIDDLLDITRVARGKLNLDLRNINVHEALQDALRTVRAEMNFKHISVTMTLDARQFTISADPVRLQQVFWNLLKNAIKFTPEGGRIAIATSSKDEAIRIRFADTGVGMLAHELDRVFEAFAQGDHSRPDGSRRFGGLGLGLAISRQLITLHGGSIAATSAGPGAGSAFTIDLPLAQAGAANAPAPTPVDSTPISFSSHKIRRVLIVEDHLTTRISMARILERRGLTVTTAGSLAEARSALRDGNIDLLISDIGLPDGSGHELKNEFEVCPHLRGIAISGFGMDADIAQSRECGFSAHLTKPVSVRALEAALAAMY